MKTTKDLLKETFASIPNNFAYREVKFYVYHALQKLETLEKREITKQKQQHERQVKEEEMKKTHAWMPPIYQNSYQVQRTLDMIDQMIAEEKKVIEDVHKKGQKSETKNDSDGDDELQTIHG